MSHKSTLKSRVFAQAELVIPTEFYDVREETHPKAGWVPMYGLTTLLYTAAVIAFTLLYVSEKQNGTVETIITAYDKTGSDGYTCQMISLVTATYQINTAADPSLAYNLVNVMESATECSDNLQEASPCDHPLTYFPGSAPATIEYSTGTVFGAVALFGANLTYTWVRQSDSYVYLAVYSYVDGSLGIVETPNMVSTTSLAADAGGNPVYIATMDGYAQLCRTNPSNALEVLYNTEQPYTPMVLNDNLNNIYIVLNNTFTAVDIYSHPAESTLIFNVSVSDEILYAAVYNSGNALVVYYVTVASSAAGELCTFLHDVSSCSAWDYGSHATIKGLSVDGFNRLYLLILPSDGSGEYYVVGADGFFGLTTSTTLPTGFGISPSGERIIVATMQLPVGPQFGFIYPLAPDSTGEGHYYEVVAAQTGFGAGWFTCDNQVLNSTEYTPSTPAEYPQSCELNGVVGKVVYNAADTYHFTSADAQTFATQNAVPYCTSLYAPIVKKVSKLPPYSCSRTLHPGFFSCLATAFANTTFLMQLMVFCFALMLPKLAARFPVQEESAEARKAEGVEMTSAHAHDVENPMQ